MEQVAAAAGVGKGTVFHRFGNRTGLMYALMVERAQALEEAVTAGPPPLGPGAPDRDRLLAFLDAIIEVVGRNKSLLAELAYSAAAEPPPEHRRCARTRRATATTTRSTGSGTVTSARSSPPSGPGPTPR